MKLRKFYDLVHSLTEDHRITKTKIAGPPNKYLPQNVASPPTERGAVFEKFVFPRQKGVGGGHYENTFTTFWSITCFSANWISQFKNKPNKLFDLSVNCDWLHTHVWKLSITINQFHKNDWLSKILEWQPSFTRV